MNVQGGDQSVHTSWTNTPIMIWMSRALFNSVCVEIVRAGRIDNGFRPADLGTQHAGPLLCERMPYIPPTFARPLSRVHRPWRARPPSAPHRLRPNASGRCLRRGLATARPTPSGTNSTFCAVLRSVCGAFLSGWGLGTLTGSTTGQPVRTARHLAPRSKTTRKPQLRGHGGGWVAPPTSHPLRPNQPSSTTGTVYDRLGLPAGPTDVRPMGSVQNCGIPVHTVSYRRHHAEGDALPFPPADRSSRICPRTT